jgi:hypothetical protein
MGKIPFFFIFYDPSQRAGAPAKWSRGKEMINRVSGIPEYFSIHYLLPYKDHQL